MANETPGSKLTAMDGAYLKQISMRLSQIVKSIPMILDWQNRTILNNKCYGTKPPETYFANTTPIEGQLYFYIEEDK